MKNFFKTIANNNKSWFSETIGEHNGSPVAVRVMNNFSAPFHTHETDDEMFIVLKGSVQIDTPEGTTIISSGQSYTVAAGIKHRARVDGRAELIVIGGKNI